MKPTFLAPILALLVVVPGCKKSDGGADGTPASSAAGDTPALGALAALKGFEGEITVAVKSNKEKRPVPPVTVSVKGAKFRFDVPEGMENAPRMGNGAHMIVDAPGKRLLAIVDEKKQVVVIGLDTLSEQMKSFKPPHGAAEPETDHGASKVTKTGKTDTVAGYKCEEWEAVSTKGEKAHICVASEDTSWFELPSLSLPSEHAWAKELFDGHHLPLRMIGYDAAGAEESRIEVTKLEKKPMADALFEPPQGYQVMDMGAMMRGMMGAMGMPQMGMPGAPAAAGSGAPAAGLPPGFQLPPGVKLPPNVQLPPNMQMPAGAAEMMKQMQERARAAGIQTPPPPPPAH